MKKLLSTDPRILEAIQMYQSGVTFKEVLKTYHLDGETLNKFLNEKGLKKTKSEQVRKGKGVHTLNENCFDILLPDAMYWIGFLYSDGHIEKDRPRVTFTLSGKDRTHIDKFNVFMGGALSIRDVTQENKKAAPGQKNFGQKYYRIGFSSLKIYSRLKELGFTHNKTYGITPHESLKYSRDFFRGVVDGDGWVCWLNQKNRERKGSVGLSGSEETIQSFLDFIKFSGIITAAAPRKDKRAHVWKVDLHTQPAIKVLTLLYKDAPVYLDRKYLQAQEIINGIAGASEEST